MKEIYILPTTHKSTINYHSDDIAKIIIKINPEVIFNEFPKNWDEKKLKEKHLDDQESAAIEIVKQTKIIKVENVDIPYRNEIATSMNLYAIEDEIFSIIFNENKEAINYGKMIDKLMLINEKLFLPEEKICYEYLKSNEFRKNVRIKQNTIKKIMKANQGMKGGCAIIDHSLDHFFHNELREKTIVHNCLQSMKNYNKGLLMIGAEHIDIVNKFKKIGHKIIKTKYF